MSPMADCCVLGTATTLSLLRISFHSGLKNVASGSVEIVSRCEMVEIVTNRTLMSTEEWLGSARIIEGVHCLAVQWGIHHSAW